MAAMSTCSLLSKSFPGLLQTPSLWLFSHSRVCFRRAMPGLICPQIPFRVVDSLTSLTVRDGFLFLEISNKQSEIGDCFLFYFRISYDLSFYYCCSPHLDIPLCSQTGMREVQSIQPLNVISLQYCPEFME